MHQNYTHLGAAWVNQKICGLVSHLTGHGFYVEMTLEPGHGKARFTERCLQVCDEYSANRF
jgi:hypothetical protein